MEQPTTVIDLFAGVGGLSLGFQQLGFEIVYANEIDPQIAASYKNNHPGTEVSVEDINGLDLESEFVKLRDKATVVLGGPPCQGFSQKGSRKTIHDERNYLFRQFVKVVEIVRPKYFVMENVPNLLTSENGAFKLELTELFEGLGYSVSASVMNASDFGVPQNRRRAIIIGKKDGGVVAAPVQTNRHTTVWDAISDLAFLESGEGGSPMHYRKQPESDYQREMRKGSQELHNHIATRHTEIALQRFALIPANCTTKVLPEEHVTKSIYSGTWTRLDSMGQATTITTRFDTPSSGQFTHPYLDRAITVREAARLQSFPDNFIFSGPKSSQMKQVGNAVPPMLSYAIASAICSDLDKDKP